MGHLYFFPRLVECHRLVVRVLICFLLFVKTLIKINMGEENLFCLIAYSLLWREIKKGTQGRNPEAIIKTEAVGKWCLLPCFLWIAQLVSYTSHAQGQHHSQWLGPSTSIINKEHAFYTLKNIYVSYLS